MVDGVRTGVHGDEDTDRVDQRDVLTLELEARLLLSQSIENRLDLRRNHRQHLFAANASVSDNTNGKVINIRWRTSTAIRLNSSKQPQAPLEARPLKILPSDL